MLANLITIIIIHCLPIIFVFQFYCICGTFGGDFGFDHLMYINTTGFDHLMYINTTYNHLVMNNIQSISSCSPN